MQFKRWINKNVLNSDIQIRTNRMLRSNPAIPFLGASYQVNCTHPTRPSCGQIPKGHWSPKASGHVPCQSHTHSTWPRAK